MADGGSLEGLQDLHQDLIALSESQLRNVERLWAELDARVDEFRKLLDKPQKNDASRRLLQSGESSSRINGRAGHDLMRSV